MWRLGEEPPSLCVRQEGQGLPRKGSTRRESALYMGCISGRISAYYPVMPNKQISEGVTMSWIKTIPYAEASGELKKIYDETKNKFGKIINLVKIQSLRPETMAIGRNLYRHLMALPDGLNRKQRVLIATVVSSLNGCHY